MLRSELLAETQDIINDSYSGGMISEASILRYMAEGQDEFCKRSGFFLDFYNFQLITEVGVDSYTLDSRFIEVHDVFEPATNRSLGRTTQELRRGVGYADSFPVEFATNTSDTSCWQVDKEAGILTMVPVPTTVRTFTLQVWRRALVALNHQTDGSYDAEPEIPEDYHLALPEWAAFKIFSRHDMEVQDPVKANEHAANFRQYCRDGKEHFRRLTRQEVRCGFDQAYVVR